MLQYHSQLLPNHPYIFGSIIIADLNYGYAKVLSIRKRGKEKEAKKNSFSAAGLNAFM